MKFGDPLERARKMVRDGIAVDVATALAILESEPERVDDNGVASKQRAHYLESRQGRVADHVVD